MLGWSANNGQRNGTDERTLAAERDVVTSSEVWKRSEVWELVASSINLLTRPSLQRRRAKHGQDVLPVPKPAFTTSY